MIWGVRRVVFKCIMPFRHPTSPQVSSLQRGPFNKKKVHSSLKSKDLYYHSIYRIEEPLHRPVEADFSHPPQKVDDHNKILQVKTVRALTEWTTYLNVLLSAVSNRLWRRGEWDWRRTTPSSIEAIGDLISPKHHTAPTVLSSHHCFIKNLYINKDVSSSLSSEPWFQHRTRGVFVELPLPSQAPTEAAAETQEDIHTS